MEESKKATVYTKTRKNIQGYILEAITSYNNLFIYKIALSGRSEILTRLLDKEIKWIEFYINEDAGTNKRINESFYMLKMWLETFYQKESTAGTRDHDFKELDNIIKSCYCSIFEIFIYCPSVSAETIQRSSNLNFPKIKSKGLSTTVKLYLKSKITQQFDTDTQEIEFDEMIEILNLHFTRFLGNGINQIFVKEIRKYIIEDSGKVSDTGVERILDYIYENLECFTKFINRNYLYNVVEDALRGQISYENLQTTKNCDVRYSLTINVGEIYPYMRRNYTITCKGIEDSPRYCEDKLVIIGRESSQEFTNDITLPELSEIDSIFGVIFINNQTLGLIDISTDSVIRIRLEPGEKIKIKSGMVVAFGDNHIVIFRIDGKGHNRRLEISPFNDCETTKHLEKKFSQDNSKGNGIMIGYSENCKFKLKHEDVAHEHSLIYFEENKFWLENLLHDKNTSYLLKKSKEFEEKKPSRPFILEHLKVFYVKDYAFTITKEN